MVPKGMRIAFSALRHASIRSLVGRQPAKLLQAGSIPAARANFAAFVSRQGCRSFKSDLDVAMRDVGPLVEREVQTAA